MKQNEKRIQIFDIAKGISILLMAISRYEFNTIYPFLTAFLDIVMVLKMPTFIFISGYLLSNRLDFKSFLYHKIDGLIKPLIGFILSLTLLKIIFYLITSDTVTFGGVFGPVINLGRYVYHGSFDAINVSFWFIMALFLGQITLKGFLEIKEFDKPKNYIFLTAFFLALFVLNTFQIRLHWTHYIPIFFTYLLLGYSFKQISTRYLNGTSFFYSNKMLVFPILFFISQFMLNRFNIKIDFNLAGLHYNYHYLLILSLLGVFTVLFLCRYIEKIPILNSFLVYCSRASFFILAYHIFIIDVQLVLFDLKSYNPLLHSILFFSNTIICCLIYRFLKKVPFVRMAFYPIKTIALSDAEIKLLQSKYINKFIPKTIFIDTATR